MYTANSVSLSVCVRRRLRAMREISAQYIRLVNHAAVVIKFTICSREIDRTRSALSLDDVQKNA